MQRHLQRKPDRRWGPLYDCSHQLQTEFQEEELVPQQRSQMKVLVAAFSLQLPGSEWEIGSEEHSPQVEAQSNVGKCGEEGYSRTCGERVCAIAIVQSIVSSTV